MPRLYLIRHAEPSVTGVILGRANPELSEAGKAAAAKIDPPLVDVVYTSRLARAIQTAEILWSKSHVRHVILGELDEIGYGEWDGRSWAEIVLSDPALAEAKLADWRNITPPGGESWQEFEARVQRAWKQILSGTFPACVVAHSAVNAVLCREITAADPLEFQQSHGEILTYEF